MSSLKKKKPRFFCDNCGYEVGSDIKSCPYCGRFFASVRCPACGYSGPDKMFKSGCPMCGYCTSPAQKSAKIFHGSPKKKYVYTAHPPAMALIITVIFLLAAVAILSWFITR